MDLEWSTPLDDGNAAITSYHIEAKEKGHEEDWQIWETIDTNRTKATVNGLQKGREYQFRVIAINKAGKSDPSHPSRTKEALPRSRKPNRVSLFCQKFFKKFKKGTLYLACTNFRNYLT